VAEIPGVKSANVQVVWDPPWDPSRLSEAAKKMLGLT
jgi:metal-sulfur cluster biosynthetic enzyme